MKWISGFGRDKEGCFGVQAQALDGTCALVNLDRVDASLGLAKPTRRKVTFALHQLRRGNTDEYLQSLGMGLWDASAQPVYEANGSFGTLVLPAQLIVLSVLGAQASLRRTLLTPHGPNSAVKTISDGGRIETVGTPLRMFGRNALRAPFEMRLQWVHCFPSASAAWGSVYRNALSGVFDMAMPRAEVDCTMSGFRVGKKFFATRIEVLKLRPNEEPHEFASGQTQAEYSFYEATNSSSWNLEKMMASFDPRVAQSGGVTPLTDEQWDRVKLFAHRTSNPPQSGTTWRSPKHCRREMVDIIRMKLGTPCSWANCPGDKALVQSASVLLSNLKRLGAWDALLEALTEVAPGCDSPCP